VVEGTGLENRQGRNPLVSSNLTPSANSHLAGADRDMKQRAAALTLAAALAGFPAVAASDAEVERSPKDRREYKGEYTPVGEFCVRKARENGLKENDKAWIMYVAQCAAAHEPPNPDHKAMAKCFADADPFRGTAEWINVFRPCMEGIIGKLRGRE
jgi:hypothetical protein